MIESEKKFLRDIGELCRNYRLMHSQTLKDVSIQMGCSLSAVGYFERGRNDSAKMLTWYIEHYKIPMGKIMKIYYLYTLGRCKDE